METTTTMTVMVMMAGLMMAAPACADEESTKSMTVPALGVPCHDGARGADVTARRPLVRARQSRVDDKKPSTKQHTMQ